MMDVVIAGGGPSGLAAAVMARQAGLAVTVYEPRPFPVDKACGEGLMRPAINVLESLGIRDLPGVDFVGIRYVDGGRPPRAVPTRCRTRCSTDSPAARPS